MCTIGDRNRNNASNRAMVMINRRDDAAAVGNRDGRNWDRDGG